MLSFALEYVSNSPGEHRSGPLNDCFSDRPNFMLNSGVFPPIGRLGAFAAVTVKPKGKSTQG
ncbi:hypothetical protein CLV75_3981 [Ruegeria conchae]|uniref:Uncharacterized protein n=1 Tax=Ruegeria conchae TaxID=981384 RepID=A0A497YSB2_9RHOB|nr:hypothetical protein CLV75_3981 [Ruegeria conchae]